MPEISEELAALVAFAKRHWVALSLLVLAATWGFGMSLVFQKGFLDDWPNWACFALLAGPVVGVVILGLAHPETRARYYLLSKYPKMTLAAFMIGGAFVGGVLWILFFITHPATSLKQLPSLSAGPTSTPLPTTARVIPRSGVSLSGGDHNVFHGLTILGEYQDAALKTDKESNLTINNAYIAQSRISPAPLPLLDQALLDEFRNHEGKWLLLDEEERNKRREAFDALEQKIRRSTDTVERESLLGELRALP